MKDHSKTKVRLTSFQLRANGFKEGNGKDKICLPRGVYAMYHEASHSYYLKCRMDSKHRRFSKGTWFKKVGSLPKLPPMGPCDVEPGAPYLGSFSDYRKPPVTLVGTSSGYLQRTDNCAVYYPAYFDKLVKITQWEVMHDAR